MLRPYFAVDLLAGYAENAYLCRREKLYIIVMSLRTAVIGGGAAGFFLAVNLKEMMPTMDVTILERSPRVLAKVAMSGGGRCNCTNTFRQVSDLSAVYPRGHRLLKRLFNVFSPTDAYAWFERHGLPLTIQDDECVFPQAQDAQAVVGCFRTLARRYDVHVLTSHKVDSLRQLADYDFVAVTTGGSPTGQGLRWLADCGHEVEPPVPSLFSLTVGDEALHQLMGLVVADASVRLPATKLRADGPLLITHWGLSGPAILRLSSYGARQLADHDYRMPLSVGWVALSETDVHDALQMAVVRDVQRQLSTCNPLGLQQRLWNYLADRALGERSHLRWSELGKKDLNRLTNILTNDTYQTHGRAPFKDEFVTCGGVSLRAVSATTLESRHVPRLYFAGEVLDIDGVTGGFNFQAAWTTAYVAASSIAEAATR